MSPGLVASGPAPKPPSKPLPASSTSDLKQNQTPTREKDPRAVKQEQPQSPAAASLAKTAASTAGVATPRRREKKDKDKEMDIVKRLQQICTDADPTRLYRNLVKIGQGLVVFSSNHVYSLLTVIQRFRRCLYCISSRNQSFRSYQANGSREAAQEGSYYQ